VAVFNLRFNTGRLASPVVASTKPGARESTLNNLLNTIQQMIAGGLDNQSLRCDVTPLAASGTITLSGSSGVLTATINGVAIATGSLAGTDTENAVVLAAAINASSNALVSGLVTASSAAGVVTITAVKKQKDGNMCTLAASGTGATASGARLTGGSDGTTTSFTC
jgi:phage tail sheath gpL-like